MESFLLDNDWIYWYQLVMKESTPNYFQLVANNQPLPENPYSVSKTRYEKSGLIYQRRNVATNAISLQTGQVRGDIVPCRDLVNYAVSDVAAKADNALLSKLKGQSIAVGMMLAERKETAKMLENFGLRTLRALKAIRHPKQFFRAYRDRNPTSRELRILTSRMRKPRSGPSVGDRWLAGRYAWMPLFMDIRDSAHAFEKASQKQQGGTTKQVIRRAGQVSADTGSSFGSRKELNGFCDYDVFRSITLRWKVSDPILAAFGDLQDPLTWAWDAVPYSFAIDWLVDVSSYLERNTATLGLSFIKGSTVSVNSRVYTFQPKPYETLSSNKVYACKLKAGIPQPIIMYELSRQPLAAFPSPHLTYVGGITGMHLADTFALIKGRLRKR